MSGYTRGFPQRRHYYDEGADMYDYGESNPMNNRRSQPSAAALGSARDQYSDVGTQYEPGRYGSQQYRSPKLNSPYLRDAQLRNSPHLGAEDLAETEASHGSEDGFATPEQSVHAFSARDDDVPKRTTWKRTSAASTNPFSNYEERYTQVPPTVRPVGQTGARAPSAADGEVTYEDLNQKKTSETKVAPPIFAAETAPMAASSAAAPAATSTTRTATAATPTAAVSDPPTTTAAPAATPSASREATAPAPDACLLYTSPSPRDS